MNAQACSSSLLSDCDGGAGDTGLATALSHTTSITWDCPKPCRWRSAEPLPGRLARHSQRRTNLRPTHFARSKNIHHLLQLVAPPLDGVLDRLKTLQQALSW